MSDEKDPVSEHPHLSSDDTLAADKYDAKSHPRKTITYHETFEDPGSTAAEYFSTQEVGDLSQLYDGGLQIGKIIGQGGMGIVHEAYQQLPGRTVAVKKLYRPNRRLSGVLMNEAMIMGSLEHPNIVPVHIVRIPEVYSPEVVMKRIDGQSLMDVLNGVAMRGDGLRRVLETLKQVCLALEYAHAQQVIHRDIKPENIMLGSFGEVYLLDWGIAVRLDRIDEMPKGLVGTPSYMAPEMLSGFPKDVSPLTDVFLMGAMLHEILTAQPRHDAQGALGALSQASRCEPYEYASDVPQELATLTNQACALDPHLRPQSIADFRARIEHFLERWDADRILTLAMDKLSVLEALIDESTTSIDSAARIRQAFTEARIGFEQVLHIDQTDEKACQGLHDTVVTMVGWLLDCERWAEAELLFATAPLSDPAIEARIKTARHTLDQNKSEAAALRSFASEFDRNPSRKARKVLAFIFATLVLLTVVFALIYDHFNPKPITPQRLLATTGTTALITVLVTFIWRKPLFANQIGRRLVRSIVFGLVCAIGFTAGAIRLDLPGEAVLLADIFIASLAMANTYPVIANATKATGVIFACGVLSVIYPPFVHAGLMITMVVGSGCLLYDWVKRDTEEA